MLFMHYTCMVHFTTKSNQILHFRKWLIKAFTKLWQQKSDNWLLFDELIAFFWLIALFAFCVTKGKDLNLKKLIKRNTKVLLSICNDLKRIIFRKMKNIIFDCQIFKTNPSILFVLWASKAASQTYQLHTTYMLWFNFILGLNSILLCFKLIITHYHTQKQKK